MVNCIICCGEEGMTDEVQLALRETFPGAEFQELISWRMKKGTEPKKTLGLLVKTGETPEYGWQIKIFNPVPSAHLYNWDGSELPIHTLHYMTETFWEWLEKHKPPKTPPDSGSS